MGFSLCVVRGTVLTLVLLVQPAQAQDAERSGFEVSVHGRTTRSSARAEQAAWLSVTVPLDALALPRAGRVAVTPVAADPSVNAAPLEAAPPSSASELSWARLQALSSFAQRATVVALAVAGVAAERRRLDSLSARARASAALPELRLRAQRNTDQALRWAPTNDDPYRVTQADGAGTTLEASATFRLDRLLFAREELNVERLREQAGSERLKLERRVLDAVLALFKARELACAAAETETEAKTQQLLRTAELFTELDVLTAGWFSAHAASFSRAVWGFPEAVLGVCRSLSPLPPTDPAPTKPVATLTGSG